jgi:hypothetical protein
MEAVEAISLDDAPPDNLPLLAAGLRTGGDGQFVVVATGSRTAEQGVPNRATASLTAFRDLLVSLTDVARAEPVSFAISKMLDQSGYLQDRATTSEDSESRIENLAELVSAAREYESRETEPALGGFVDRLSLLSDVDEEAGSKDAGVDDDAPQRRGLEFRWSFSPASRRTVSALAVGGRRRRTRRRAAALLSA